MVCACGVCSCSSGVMSNPITEGCVGRAAPCDVAAIARCRSPSRARATLKPPSSSVFRAQALRCCRSLVSRRPQLCIYTGVAFVEQESFTCRGLFIVVVVLRRSSSLKSSSLQVVDVHSSGQWLVAAAVGIGIAFSKPDASADSRVEPLSKSPSPSSVFCCVYT